MNEMVNYNLNGNMNGNMNVFYFLMVEKKENLKSCRSRPAFINIYTDGSECILCKM